MVEGVDDSVGGNIFNRDGRWPSRMSIDDGEEVSEAIGRRHSDQVGMDMRKTFGRDLEISDGSHRMTVYFGPLAFDALSCPTGDICVDIGPHKLGSNCLPRPRDTRVA